ncbi:MAG: hypothetical protein AB7G28_10875 [Pirellulales bacterium]
MVRSTSCLLIAALVLCPLLCGGGRASPRAGSATPAHGCSCCDRPASTGQGDSCPADHSPARRGHSCQCICGGAIAGDAAPQVVALDWSWSLPVAVIELPMAQLLEESQLSSATAPWPDVGPNHGRALCYLFSTMQC